MDRTTERALKRAVRDEAAVRLRGDAVGSDAVEALIRRLVEEIASESGISLPPYEFEGLRAAPATAGGRIRHRDHGQRRRHRSGRSGAAFSRPHRVRGACRAHRVPSRCGVRRCGARASHHQQDRRTVGQAMRRRARHGLRDAAGRPGARHLRGAAYRAGRAGAQRAHVLVEHAGHGGSRAHGYADRRDGAVPSRGGAGALPACDIGRHRIGQDHPLGRSLWVHPSRRAGDHHRGHARAAPANAACGADADARGEHGGRGIGEHARAGGVVAASSSRSHHRRRVPRRTTCCRRCRPIIRAR